MKSLIYSTLLLVICNQTQGAVVDDGKTNAFGLSGRAAALTNKCQVCIETEFIPAYSKPYLENWNTSDFGEYSSFPTCGAKTEKTCDAGEMCAKKTITYIINAQGIEYKTFVRVCSAKNLHGTEDVPMSGQCYDDKTKGATNKTDDVEKVATWCYCRNQDFCNQSNSLQIWSASMILALLTVWIFSN